MIFGIQRQSFQHYCLLITSNYSCETHFFYISLWTRICSPKFSYHTLSFCIVMGQVEVSVRESVKNSMFITKLFLLEVLSVDFFYWNSLV